MVSPDMDDLESDSPPRKKHRSLESTRPASENRLEIATVDVIPETVSEPLKATKKQKSDTEMTSNTDFRVGLASAENEQMEREIAAGIEDFVSDGAGFQGILKQRYSDFLVNEIMPDGKVSRLNDPELLKVPALVQGGKEQSTTSSNGTGTTDRAQVSHTNGTSSSLCSESTHHNTSIPPEPSDLELISIQKILASGIKHGPEYNAINLTSQDLKGLKKFFGVDQIRQLATMYIDLSHSKQRGKAAYGTVDSEPIDDKSDRKEAHHVVRAVFDGKIETAHTDGNIVRCSVASHALSRASQANAKSGRKANKQPTWADLGGDYLHFSLYKENRDSGDVLGYLASRLGIRNQKIFDTAGIKDRRAATVQRISAYHLTSDRLLKLNNTLNQSRVGDCAYNRNKLQLGDLAGNEFVITLRDCAVRIPNSNYTTLVPEEIHGYVHQGLRTLREKGFINYYGLQRFGSFATRTDTVGQYMINGDYKAAVDTIIEYSPVALTAAKDEDNDQKISLDDKKRAKALDGFRNKSADTKTILDTLPRRFIAEQAVVRFLCNEKDTSTPYYRGALEAIPRGTRTLYPHAYQSFIWNLAATHRWRLSPGELIPGDLVLAHRAPQSKPTFQTTTYDAEGEPIFEPGHNDRASIHDQYEGDAAYALTEEDIASDRYSIFDVVLPQPGFQIQYPSFMLNFYKTAMAQHGGIDPLNMHRNWRDISLPGTYRKLLGRPFENWSFKQVWYDGTETQIAQTDLDVLKAKQAQLQESSGKSAQNRPLHAADAADAADTTFADTILAPPPPPPPQPSISPSHSEIALAKDIPHGKRLAIVLKFQLPSSTYATMALRELMKPGPIEFRPEYSEGR